MRCKWCGSTANHEFCRRWFVCNFCCDLVPWCFGGAPFQGCNDCHNLFRFASDESESECWPEVGPDLFDELVAAVRQ